MQDFNLKASLNVVVTLKNEFKEKDSQDCKLKFSFNLSLSQTRNRVKFNFFPFKIINPLQYCRKNQQDF